MSETEDLPTGRDSMEMELGGRQPLPQLNPAPDEPKEYARGDAGIVEAANDLSRERGLTEDPLIEIQDKRHSRDDRKYYTTVEDAAHDLSQFHKGEDAIQAAENLNELQREVDIARAQVSGQPDTQQQPAQAEQPQQPQPDGPQPESGAEPSTPGIDPDFAKLLAEKPQLRAQLEAPFQQAEAARQAFAGATQQIADVALSSVLANFPELQGVSGAELPTVLSFIQKQDPVKAQAIQNQLQQVNAVYSAAQQAKAEQAQRAYAQFLEFGKQQDAVFENATRGESKETIRAAAEEIVNFAVENGISKDTLAQLYATQPIMRSAVFQQMMLDAAKYRMATRSAMTNRAPHALPAVQKPGIAPSAGERSAVDLSELRAEFKRAKGNEQLRLGAKLHRLQREARR